MPLPAERIETRILTIRGHRVMIDAALAELYGVTTGALNQAEGGGRVREPAQGNQCHSLPRIVEDLALICGNLASVVGELPCVQVDDGGIIFDPCQSLVLRKLKGRGLRPALREFSIDAELLLEPPPAVPNQTD